MIECPYHHEDDGWLPLDGETDRVPYECHRTVRNDGIDESEALHILWPTEYVRCPCSESDLLPRGVEFDD